VPAEQFGALSVQKARAKKLPNPTDQHVGTRVRMRRKMLSMSQTELGAGLGLTFQQVQKYENGKNRIGASRLHQISNILQVPISFFFEDPLEPSAGNGHPPQTHSTAYVSDFLASNDGLALTKAFIRIKDPKVRRSLVKLVQDIAAGDD
jgi:transcriptional regulator with XRE-family HTH domain